MDQNIGKRLDGRYEITELVGMGGMADVYKARDIMENKDVAVKVLKPEFATNEEFLRRFRNESKAIAVLSHPNIVKIYDVGFSDKIQYIVMEYIDGITLKEYMEQQGVLKWKEALRFTSQILKALQHAHDRGIVHRDIKPQNIMLFTDGNIKVMDFGIARFARETAKTLSDKTIGSVHYISPEQARGDVTDEKSDIYSVGAMLYEMVTGKKPFEADTPVAVALMHMKNIAVRPTILQPSIPLGLEEIIQHAMQKEPSKRYSSASSMMKDVELIRNNPAVVFGYTNYDAHNSSNGSTIHFNPLTAGGKISADEAAAVAADKKNSKKPSTTLTILLSVTIGVVIIAVLFIFIATSKLFNTPDDEITMPNLVGKEYTEVEKANKNIKFEVKEEYSVDYPEGYVVSQSKKAGRKIKIHQTVVVGVSQGAEMQEVPSVVNWDYSSAEKELTSKGFKVTKSQAYSDSVTEGNVIETDPKEYEKVAYGSQIVVTVSRGPLAKEFAMPNLVGLKYDDAQATYSSQLSFIEVDQDGTEAKGTIISQEIPAGQTVTKGTTVKVYVSTGTVANNKVPISISLNKTSGIDYTGDYTFEAQWADGTKAATVTQNIIGASSVNMEVTGSGTQTILIKVQGSYNGKASDWYEYIKFDLDFKTGKSTNSKYITSDALSKINTQINPQQPAQDNQ